jgi:LmbE family N-acetylglucosaminyl deacetylase
MMKSRLFEEDKKQLNTVLIVAHPDDEALWAGGLILLRQAWNWTIVSLCRKNDPDRAPKFLRALERWGATGEMGEMDDGPDQSPLAAGIVQAAVMGLLKERSYDIIITHSPFGEYTRHRRHEETGLAVAGLWTKGDLTAEELWLFAYKDGSAERLPEAIGRAHLILKLDESTWQAKYDTIVNLYGFARDSWEARVTPKREAFWCCHSSDDYQRWLNAEGKQK